MAGLMMNAPLLISNLIEHADRHHPDAQIVSRRPEDGAIHRYTYQCVVCCILWWFCMESSKGQPR